MPIDRFLHPRAGKSHKVSMLTDLEYRVWTQYLLSADDFGVMRGTAVAFQNDNDHLANRKPREVQRCIDALVKASLVRRFEHQGKPYLFQHDWQKWQKVEYPRATLEPMPPEDALAACDEDTRKLFALHPGGRGEKFTRRSGSVRKVPPEYSEGASETSATNARVRTREVANGLRLAANGLEGGVGETTVPMDEWFETLRAAYPPSRVTSGHLTMKAFCDALLGARDGQHAAWRRMQDNLENQKRGHEWRVKGMVPKLQNWLGSGAWEQRHDEAPPAAEQLTAKTNRTLSAAAGILGGRTA